MPRLVRRLHEDLELFLHHRELLSGADQPGVDLHEAPFHVVPLHIGSL